VPNVQSIYVEARLPKPFFTPMPLDKCTPLKFAQ
jgi:hypothetical protein